MHNLDRSTLDMHESAYDYEAEFEFEADDSDMIPEDEAYNDYDTEFEDYSEDEYEWEFEYDEEDDHEPDLSQEDEYELAAELLSVTSDEEMETYLDEVRKRVVRRRPHLRKRAASMSRTRRGKAMKKRSGGLFKKIAKGALKVGGAAIGGAIGGPLGAKIGSAAGKGIGKLVGLELEGLSPEDQEFEVAKKLTKFQAKTEKNLVKTPKDVPPKVAVKRAVRKAAVKHLPGLVNKKPNQNRQSIGGRRQKDKGVWFRNQQGNIVLRGI